MSTDDNPPEFADTIILNGKIYTCETSNPWAEAVAIRHGRFTAVGRAADSLRRRGPNTAIIDLAGRFAMPGIVDGHNHAFDGARASLFELRLEPQWPLERVLQEVEAHAARDPSPGWIVGGPWGSQLIPELSTGAALASLDAKSPGHPVLLRDRSLHARFANSRALAIAGIDRSTANPTDGHIMRDARSGEATGLLLEGACFLADRVVPPFTAEQNRLAARRAVELLNAFGVTAFQQAVASATMLSAFREIDEGGELTCWLSACLAATETLLSPQRDGIGETLLRDRERFRGAHISVDFVKYFMDGVPSGRTAAFLEPYNRTSTDQSDVYGDLYFTVDELAANIARLDAQGLSVKVHAVGDRAIRDVLDAVAKVRERNGKSGPLHHIAHATYIRPDDIPRLRALNVVADICPPLWYPLPNRPEKALLGPDRAGRAYPVRDMIAAGALVSAGTDWPASAPDANPWPGVSGLITRRNPHGSEPGALWAEQAVGVGNALRLATKDAARALRIDHITGSIASGKSADLIILDRNVFAVEPIEIAHVKVKEVYFAGRNVYRSN
jgi:predicted amidohydrolase YtcJ